VTAPNDTNTIDREAIAAKLDEARALVERGWTQDNFAQDASGQLVVSNSPEAVCFCAAGAVGRVQAPWWESLAALEKAVGTNNIVVWNDAPERTQAEVVEAFKRAAAGLRSGEITL